MCSSHAFKNTHLTKPKPRDCLTASSSTVLTSILPRVRPCTPCVECEECGTRLPSSARSPAHMKHASNPHQVRLKLALNACEGFCSLARCSCSWQRCCVWWSLPVHRVDTRIRFCSSCGAKVEGAHTHNSYCILIPSADILIPSADMMNDTCSIAISSEVQCMRTMQVRACSRRLPNRTPASQ